MEIGSLVQTHSSYYLHGLVQTYKNLFHNLLSKKEFIDRLSLMMPLRESAVFVSS